MIINLRNYFIPTYAAFGFPFIGLGHAGLLNAIFIN